MKKTILVVLLAVFGISQTFAQDHEYIPFVREGVKWICYYDKVNGSGFGYYLVDEEPFHVGRNYFTLELKGDVEIDGKVYKAMHKYSGEAIDKENDTILVYLREEDKVVYGIVPEGERYRDFLIGYGGVDFNDYPYPEVDSGKEFVLYNFNDPNSFCQWVYRRHPDRIKDTSSDLIDIGGRYAQRYKYTLDESHLYDLYLIEGIGADGYDPCYPLFYMIVGFRGPFYYLSHVVEDDEIIYKGINYDYLARWDGRLPIAREGMKWVNERVIINKGDTTRCYYTYELQGFDPNHEFKDDNEFFYCHYYTGDGIDPNNDSIICSIGEFPSFNWTLAINNPAMDLVIQEGRNMLERKMFSETQPIEQLHYICHDNPRRIYHNYYSWQIKQKPFSITEETFFEVEPVEIEGHECRRYAYVGEDGEPLAYVVEGIGFDSRDMGDLLTPFTRKPDPDADYQEYWGLSHVIKDGKIIYKGMRYREDVPAELSGDVNGDGAVNIADVTTLIDLLLSGNSELRAPSDLDSNGRLTIEDVTLLIDRLLTIN